MSKDVNLEEIVSLAKRRGYIYQGSDIYGGLAGTWDYGPLGVELKENIRRLWWDMFVRSRDDMFGIDAAILMNQKVWQASGHATGFNDPMVECSNCHSRLRQDHIEDNKCSVCGKKDTLSEPKQFNMMFVTKIGPTANEIIIPQTIDKPGIYEEKIEDRLEVVDQSKVYLRPETAQGMFVNFKNVVDSLYPDLPFGLAQIGKAFRNEISPRDFTFRSREFEQMEIEYFIKPADWQDKFEEWRKEFYVWFESIGLPEEMIHELNVPEEDRAHYSTKTIDFEFDYPFGRKELYGLAYRTDFDLKNAQDNSGKSMEYVTKGTTEKLIPHCIEPTFGMDRTILAVLCAAFTEDEVNGEKRIYLKLKNDIAPVKIAVFPLLKNKPELVNKARQVYMALKEKYGAVMWDDNGNIGKRYRRQDEIGTPYCITIDFDTLNDDTATVRDRDTTDQKRLAITELLSILD